MSLHLRRRADGTLSITGEAPDEHEFPMSFLNREIGKLVDVHVTVHTDEGDVVYEVSGFPTATDAEQPNYSALVAQKDEKRSTHKKLGRRARSKADKPNAAGNPTDPREDK